MQGVSLIRSIRPGTWGAVESRWPLGHRPAQAQRGCRRGERIGDVEIAQQREGTSADPNLPSAEIGIRPHRAPVGGPHIGGRMKPEGEPGGAGRHRLPGLIVQVHDLDAGEPEQ